MTDETLPRPESCANNMFRAADGSGRPEPSSLCRNALGVFHMLDCPLFLGRPCTYYAPAEEQRAAVDDLVLEEAALELRRDFLSWGYGRRVRGLSQPVDAWPVPIAVEPVEEPEESGIIAKRAAPEAEPEVIDVVDVEDDGEGAAASDQEEEPEAAEPEPVAAPGARRPELYPGQRRSEERTKRKVIRPAPADEVDAPADDADDAEDEVDEVEAVEPERPRTIEELFNALPEAHLPDRIEREEKPRRGRRGGRSRGRGAGAGRGEGGSNKGAGAKQREGAPSGRRSGGGGAKKDESGAGGEAGGRRRRGRRRGGRSGAEGSAGEPRGRRAPGGGDGAGAGGAPGDGAGTRPGADGGDGGSGGAGGGQRKPCRRRRRRGPPREGGGGPGGSGSSPPAQ